MAMLALTLDAWCVCLNESQDAISTMMNGAWLCIVNRQSSSIHREVQCDQYRCGTRATGDGQRVYRTRLSRAGGWTSQVGWGAVLGCLYLFGSLPTKTLLWCLGWNAAGLLLYFGYGRRRSPLARA